MSDTLLDNINCAQVTQLYLHDGFLAGNLISRNINTGDNGTLTKCATAL
jgi:hypothetical protein